MEGNGVQGGFANQDSGQTTIITSSLYITLSHFSTCSVEWGSNGKIANHNTTQVYRLVDKLIILSIEIIQKTKTLTDKRIIKKCLKGIFQFLYFNDNYCVNVCWLISTLMTVKDRTSSIQTVRRQHSNVISAIKLETSWDQIYNPTLDKLFQTIAVTYIAICTPWNYNEGFYYINILWSVYIIAETNILDFNCCSWLQWYSKLLPLLVLAGDLDPSLLSCHADIVSFVRVGILIFREYWKMFPLGVHLWFFRPPGRQAE